MRSDPPLGGHPIVARSEFNWMQVLTHLSVQMVKFDPPPLGGHLPNGWSLPIVGEVKILLDAAVDH